MACAMLWSNKASCTRLHYAVAATSLLALLQSQPFKLACPSASDPGCSVASFLRSNRDSVVRAAAQHKIPLAAVAGVIAAEWILNRNFVDSLQDQWLLTRLEMHDDVWWERWAAESARAAEYARSARLLSNKWPVSLVASGYVMSFGPAQIQPRTVILACKRFSFEEPICRQDVRSLMRSLLAAEASVWLVAVILRYEAEIWTVHTRQDTRNNVGLLASLYSAGAEYHITTLPNRMNQIQLNQVGRWVENHRMVIESLLYEDTPSAFSSPFDCPRPSAITPGG